MLRILRSKIRSLLISKKIRFCAAAILLLYIIYFLVSNYIRKRETLKKIKFIESALKEGYNDSSVACEIPITDPHDPEVAQFDVKVPPNITCPGFDWVRCHLDRCQVRKQIIDAHHNIECTYRDIVHYNDSYYSFGEQKKVLGDGVYYLNLSDHVQIECTSKDLIVTNWTGHGIGFRPMRPPTTAAADKLNIMMFGFDSTSRNLFIRHMPKSYKVLKDLGAVVLQGYNIVGDGTPTALFPLLFGKSSLQSELGAGTYRTSAQKRPLDFLPNLFNILNQQGYRTLYFEDDPWGGSFQYQHSGFKNQPADHYLKSYLYEAYNEADPKFCIGDTPQFMVLTNKTKEFWERDGKKFSFTFIADITHDDHNMFGAADKDISNFLRWTNTSGLLEDTLFIMFGDHGSRFSTHRGTLIGRIEERQPLMSIILPRKLKRDRPSAVSSLARNAEVLTTPFDVHTTVLDAVGLKSTYNYTVQGARIPRGLSLLRAIPKNRTCWDAEVSPYFCVCARWENISDTDPRHRRAGEALVKSINQLIAPYKMCKARSLLTVQSVMRQRANKNVMLMLRHGGGGENTEIWNAKMSSELLMLKVSASPGVANYEATLTYQIQNDTFEVDWKAVQRTNAYGHEPDCITHLHNRTLNPFCYCNN